MHIIQKLSVSRIQWSEGNGCCCQFKLQKKLHIELLLEKHFSKVDKKKNVPLKNYFSSGKRNTKNILWRLFLCKKTICFSVSFLLALTDVRLHRETVGAERWKAGSSQIMYFWCPTGKSVIFLCKDLLWWLGELAQVKLFESYLNQLDFTYHLLVCECLTWNIVFMYILSTGFCL